MPLPAVRKWPMTSHDNSATTETVSPPRRRRGLKLFIAVIGVLLLVVGGLWLLGVATQATELSEDTVAAEGVDRVLVQLESGRIEVVVEERPDIAITTERVSSAWNDPQSSVDVADGTLAATGECESTFFVSNCAVNYRIAVPQDMITQLDITTTAGQIEIRGSAADLNARTTAGAIRLIDYSGPSADLRTTSGGVNVQAVTPPESLSVETTAGGVGITVPDVGYQVSTDTTVGGIDVTVRQDPESDRSIAVKTTAGGISIAGG